MLPATRENVSTRQVPQRLLPAFREGPGQRKKDASLWGGRATGEGCARDTCLGEASCFLLSPDRATGAGSGAAGQLPGTGVQAHHHPLPVALPSLGLSTAQLIRHRSLRPSSWRQALCSELPGLSWWPLALAKSFRVHLSARPPVRSTSASATCPAHRCS